MQKNKTTITHDQTLEEKINLVINMLLVHKQSMRSYYDDFTNEEHDALIASDEHHTLSDALSKFYHKHNI